MGGECGGCRVTGSKGDGGGDAAEVAMEGRKERKRERGEKN